MVSPFYSLENHAGIFLLRLQSPDGTNRLTRQYVKALQEIVEKISARAIPLGIGETRGFSQLAQIRKRFPASTAREGHGCEGVKSRTGGGDCAGSGGRAPRRHDPQRISSSIE
jgi:enoyl-CoA hydratase/carnithine racemase